MSEGQTRFSVVIPTVGRAEALASTLSSVLRARPAPDEILVVDGDPGTGAASTIGATGPDGKAIKHLVTERGLTLQRNAALHAIQGDVVVFLDDDVEIPAGTFALLRAAYADPDVVGATGHVLEPDPGRLGGKTSSVRRLLPGGGSEGSFTRFGYPRRLLDTSRERDISFMQGCFMSARAEEARAVRFDENLTGYALAEDEDFSFRLSKLGRIRYLPQIRVVHHNTGFASRDHRSFSHQVVGNRLYLFRKNFPQTVSARFGFWMVILVLILHRLINREWAGARGLVEASIQEWRR